MLDDVSILLCVPQLRQSEQNMIHPRLVGLQV